MNSEKHCEENQIVNSNVNLKGAKKRKRLWRVLGITATVFLCLLGGGVIWWHGIEGEAHVKPEYEKADISALLTKASLQQEDYQLLYEQTGLNKAAINYMFSEDMEMQLLSLQEAYFADVTVKCSPGTLVTREERMVGTRASIPYVEEGDILVTFNSHLLGWRNGHVGIVVDAEKRLVLEASELGTESKVVSMNHWERYPSFAILRLEGVEQQARAAIAAYAVEYLENVPYRLEAGIWDRMCKRVNPDVKGTHCAHLVWFAYEQFGYDLDSDGGWIVTPRDIFESPDLEVVQIYGMV